MSRQYNPAIDAYRNMDIENMPDDKPKESMMGLLARKPMTKSADVDTDNPIVRIGKQMKVIRKHREEIKNGD